MKPNTILFVIIAIQSHWKFLLANVIKCNTKSGSDGICKPISECSFLKELLSNSESDLFDLTPCIETKKDRFGIIGEFCCPLTKPSNNSSQDSYLSKSCCKLVKLKEQLKPKLIDFGEHSMSEVGVKAGKLPFIAQIILDETFLGTGALVSEKFVLTSAHIVYALQTLPTIKLGKMKINDEDDQHNTTYGISVEVKQIILHELFLPLEINYNIALLMFKNPIKFYDHIWPACLYTSSDDYNEKLMTSGWMNKGKVVNDLVYNELDIIGVSECQKYDDELSKIVTKEVFCANNVRCQDFSGDFDGPVFVFTNQTFFIFAMNTKYGSKCDEDKPAIFLKISTLAEWIENIIRH